MKRPVAATRTVPRLHLVAAFALSIGLLVVAVAMAVRAGDPPLPDLLPVPWWALIPVYLAATHVTLGFERRESSVLVTLVQVPLALGVVLVAPVLHLVARVVATAVGCVLLRRQDALKVTFNLGTTALEVALAALAVSFVHVDRPGPRLWVALLVGLLLGEIAFSLAMQAMFRLLRQQVTRRSAVEPAVVALATSLVFTGLAILTISAIWTDRSTILVVLGLSLAMALAYRGYHRLSASQQATEELYAFVKELGPVDVEQQEALVPLERVRELLHAKDLELDTVDSSGEVRRHLAVHLDGAPEVEPALQDAGQVAAAGLGGDWMRTPLLAGGHVVGLLTARHRVTTDRGFDMRDLRLLETVAAELATALDRGRLLRDLGRAATTDPLTGLSNLSRATSAIDEMILQSDGVLVAAVAVDSFREVNDTLGHEVGDDLLREVALRLQQASPSALVGRIGGGRFTVAIPAREAGGDASMFGLSLRAQVEGGAQLGAVGTHVRLSVGCARAPEDGKEAATLLRRAETAMYSARHAHGGPVLWEPAYEVQGQRRLAVVMALREALSSGAIGVAFQPKISAVDGSISGVEALARWTHPALGSISPAEFIPLAEAAGLMRPLTSTVLRQSLTACRGWQGRSRGVGVAVNVSAETLQDAGFVTEVAAVLTSTDVKPGLLTLELTEDVVVADPELAKERMHELQALGIKLSVDDFGTGYSSLTYLKGLPIDEVKIDKGFVAGLVDDPGDQAVVRAVVDIAHTLGMAVVAEGVEHDDQHTLLRRLGVDVMQGYLHARPMPALDMSAWLRRREHAGQES